MISKAEKNFTPDFNINDVIEEERQNSWRFGGKTVFGDAENHLHQSQYSFLCFSFSLKFRLIKFFINIDQ